MHQTSILTDDGAFGGPVRCVVEGGRRKSAFDALCKGNEGVADLDIVHALEDELLKTRKKDVRYLEK
jgi:hypothetical protein